MRSPRDRREEHDNHERWLVSYADFMTLMFAFFVVLYATSISDREKTAAFSEGMQKALTEGRLSARVRQILGASEVSSKPGNAEIEGLKTQPREVPPDQKMAELAPSLRHLSQELKEEIARGSIELNLQARGLVISMKEAAFFPSGDSSVKLESYSIVEKVARTLQRIPNPIRVEGHTDSIPIHNARFRNNWELSAARSVAMLELLHQKFGIDPHRMAIVGYADSIAVDSNGTAEGRAKNRRVDITILNEAALFQEARAVFDR
jgi:chemotaxis protein MotB